LNLPISLRLRPKLFFGWWMVALGAFVTSINKTAVNKGFPVFILPVEEYFGASRAMVSFIFSLARSENGPTGPIAGWFVDRFGPRALLFVGATMSGGGFLVLGQTRSIWAFALIYLGVITVGSNIGFSYPMATLVNNWFYRQKAMAMSVFHAADSVIPALLVPVLAVILVAWGLEMALTVIGLVLLGTILPLAFFIRDTPESMGLTMDGDLSTGPEMSRPVPSKTRRSWVPPAHYSVKAAMRTPSYWILVLGTALRLVAKGAIMLHIIPIIVSKGVDQQTAALFFSLLLIMTIPMYLMVGWVADRFPKNWVLMAASVAGAGSFALLALPLQAVWVVLVWVLLFSIAEASAPTNWAALGEYFGRKTFSQLRGFVQFANFPGVLLAPVFVGWWFDVHGDYVVPLWIFAAVFGLGALTFGVMRNPQSGSLAGPEEPVLDQEATA
jgi:MCP family monocarboxylic acid transporter-like MFS transporter 13